MSAQMSEIRFLEACTGTGHRIECYDKTRNYYNVYHGKRFRGTIKWDRLRRTMSVSFNTLAGAKAFHQILGAMLQETDHAQDK